LVETLINDAERHPRMASISYEALIRLVSELFPSAVPFGVLFGPNIPVWLLDQQVGILDKLNVPRMNYMDWAFLAMARRMGSKHPDWVAHQLIADAITSTWWRGLELSCGKPIPQVARLSFAHSFPAPSNDVEASLSSICREPVSSYSAFSAHSLIGAPMLTGDWNLREDKPGKPGWIAESLGSVVYFPVRFHRGKLVVTWLKSYEGYGAAMVRVHAESAGGVILERFLDGLWVDWNGSSSPGPRQGGGMDPNQFFEEVGGRTSQAHSATISWPGRKDRNGYPISGKGRNKVPSGLANVTVTIVSPLDGRRWRKFKLLGVHTC